MAGLFRFRYAGCQDFNIMPGNWTSPPEYENLLKEEIDDHVFSLMYGAVVEDMYSTISAWVVRFDNGLAVRLYDSKLLRELVCDMEMRKKENDEYKKQVD